MSSSRIRGNLHLNWSTLTHVLGVLLLSPAVTFIVVAVTAAVAVAAN